MALHKEDKPAAFLGLIGGVVLLLGMVYGMVLLTNAKFADHAAPAAEAGHTGH